MTEIDFGPSKEQLRAQLLEARERLRKLALLCVDVTVWPDDDECKVRCLACGWDEHFDTTTPPMVHAQINDCPLMGEVLGNGLDVE